MRCSWCRQYAISGSRFPNGLNFSFVDGQRKSLRLPLPGLGDELCRPGHHLLQHRPQPTAFRRMPHWREVPRQPQLPDQAQAVVGEHPQMQHRVVGAELARRQPFQVAVGFDLGMELLT